MACEVGILIVFEVASDSQGDILRSSHTTNLVNEHSGAGYELSNLVTKRLVTN